VIGIDVSGTDYARLIRHLTDAAICIDLKGTILDLNKAAESLLGYASYEIVNLPFSTLYPKPWHHQVPLILDRVAKGASLSNANAQVIHKNGGTLHINLSFSPLLGKKGEALGSFLILRKLDQMKDIHVFLEDAPPPSSDTAAEGRRRTFEELRLGILRCLRDQQMTINQLATYAGMNWKTVENHLTHLLGKGFVREVFRSEYVRIFEITPQGREHLAKAGTAGMKPAEGRVKEELR
jgi:PAS domain S-box-containing protein